MTKAEAIQRLQYLISDTYSFYGTNKISEDDKLNIEAYKTAITALRKELTTVDCISKANALRVAKNEYLRGWHDALHKTLNEKYTIHCEEGDFNVIQVETITGLGLSMDCALGKNVESYMNTLYTERNGDK